MRKIGLLFLLIFTAAIPLSAEDWPQWRGVNRDGVWHESGLLEKFDAERLTPKWRVEIASGYSGPTVAKGRVYVTDRITKPVSTERVHCFDERRPLWLATAVDPGTQQPGRAYQLLQWCAGAGCRTPVYECKRGPRILVGHACSR